VEFFQQIIAEARRPWGASAGSSGGITPDAAAAAATAAAEPCEAFMPGVEEGATGVSRTAEAADPQIIPPAPAHGSNDGALAAPAGAEAARAFLAPRILAEKGSVAAAKSAEKVEEGETETEAEAVEMDAPPGAEAVNVEITARRGDINEGEARAGTPVNDRPRRGEDELPVPRGRGVAASRAERTLAPEAVARAGDLPHSGAAGVERRGRVPAAAPSLSGGASLVFRAPSAVASGVALGSGPLPKGEVALKGPSPTGPATVGSSIASDAIDPSGAGDRPPGGLGGEGEAARGEEPGDTAWRAVKREAVPSREHAPIEPSRGSGWASRAPVPIPRAVAGDPEPRSAGPVRGGPAPAFNEGRRSAAADRQPEREQPVVRIGRIDIVVEAPKLAEVRKADAEPPGEFLSRYYLRGL
jgi:hypothetical protein